MIRYLYRSLLVCSVLVVTACGFHLRGSPGSIPMTFKTLSIVGENKTVLARTLADVMRGQVIMIQAPAPAEVIVELGEVQHSKNVSVKDSQGRVSEYRLYSNVTIQAYAANKDQLIKPVTLSISRTLSTGTGYDTGIDLELSRLYGTMDAELANQIQYRLRAIKLNAQP